jgi:DNA-binding XRE family transcriptional regulator
MFGDRILAARQALGLTQTELAARAGVSRQLVGSVEAGRHLPRVDAAAGLARALGLAVEDLLSPAPSTSQPVLGAALPVGTPVRVGRVGDRLVHAELPSPSSDGWAVADGVVRPDGVELLDGARPGVVVVGCDPALGLAARLVAPAGGHVVAVVASTRAAVAALAAGRAHAVVVHGRRDALPEPPVAVARARLGGWRVGLAAPADGTDLLDEALAGRGTVVQRAAGAGTQAAYESALALDGSAAPAGPVAEGHLEAAWLAARLRSAAVTIEPAAIAAGLAFRALEEHVTELWTAIDQQDVPDVRRLRESLVSPALVRRLEAVGGYDLTELGSRVSA